jgi:hypothetical protein
MSSVTKLLRTSAQYPIRTKVFSSTLQFTNQYCPISLGLKHNNFAIPFVLHWTCYTKYLCFCIYCCCTWHSWHGISFIALPATFLPWSILWNSNTNIPSVFNRIYVSNTMTSLYNIQNHKSPVEVYVHRKIDATLHWPTLHCWVWFFLCSHSRLKICYV